jgi:hypothetical protein
MMGCTRRSFPRRTMAADFLRRLPKEVLDVLRRRLPAVTSNRCGRGGAEGRGQYAARRAAWRSKSAFTSEHG